MKDLQKLNGAKILSKKEQQTVKGGIHTICTFDDDCASDEYCATSGGFEEGVCIRIH
ncbi:hypothetical protein [Labilibaculum manganireducens]|uniref:hypothetical protein n=1 Tax=Labilibaculum manganireducens TaxID=1940525 RepID=UPI0015D5DAC0|nr:hypothetical protein [Labilibaculum manganireducens]